MTNAVSFAILMAWILAIVGWIVNLVQGIRVLMDGFDGAGAYEILQFVGIFLAPLGSFMGLVHLFKVF